MRGNSTPRFGFDWQPGGFECEGCIRCLIASQRRHGSQILHEATERREEALCDRFNFQFFKYTTLIYNWLCLRALRHVWLLSSFMAKEREMLFHTSVFMCFHCFLNILCASFVYFYWLQLIQLPEMINCIGLWRIKAPNEGSKNSVEPLSLPLLMMLSVFCLYPPVSLLQRLYVRRPGVWSRVLLWSQDPGSQHVRERMQHGV